METASTSPASSGTMFRLLMMFPCPSVFSRVRPPTVLHAPRHLLQRVQPDRRFTVAAEDHFFVPGRITDLRDHFFRFGFTRDLQIVPLHHRLALPVAEDAVRITPVGEVDVQRTLERIGEARFGFLTDAEEPERSDVRRPRNILDTESAVLPRYARAMSGIRAWVRSGCPGAGPEHRYGLSVSSS